MSQSAINFDRLDTEAGLGAALSATIGRDLFKGLTDPTERQAAARIVIIMRRLEADYGRAYEAIYGEPLPVRRRLTLPIASKKR